MSRRALRKIDPALDLSAHLTVADELPQLFCDVVLFGREAPLVVEVGSGKGLFLQSAALARPDHNFLGIEVAHKYARFAAARLAKRNIGNARVVSGDALRLFREWMPADSVRAVHVYFPDPWWKKRHHKRRVMNASFLADVERTLTTGGELHFWTDVEEYFRESLEVIASSTKLSGPLSVAERPAAHDLDYRTHFERRMRLYDKPIFRAEFRKTT
jgi:tRNA (guanine-N7-)-methyltransferase